MFYDSEHLKRGGKFGTLWLVATGKLAWQKASPSERRAVSNVNIRRTYEDLRRHFPAQKANASSRFSEARYSLYLSGMLAHAIVTIHRWQTIDALAQSAKCLVAPKKREPAQRRITNLACDSPRMMSPATFADDSEFGILRDEPESMHTLVAVPEVEEITDEELQAQFLRSRNDPNGHHHENPEAITIREINPLPNPMDEERSFGDEGGFGALALEWDTLTSSSSFQPMDLLTDRQDIPEAKRPRIEAEPSELLEMELPDLQPLPEAELRDQLQSPEVDPRQMSLELEPVVAPQPKYRRRRPCRLFIDEEVMLSDAVMSRQMNDCTNIMRQRTLDDCAERFTRVDISALLARPSRNLGGELSKLFTLRAITRPVTDDCSFLTLATNLSPQVAEAAGRVEAPVAESNSAEMIHAEPLVSETAEIQVALPSVDGITSDLEGLRLLQTRDGSYVFATSASTSRIDASASDRSMNPTTHSDQGTGRALHLETVNEVSLEGSISSRVERASGSAPNVKKAVKSQGAQKIKSGLDVLEEDQTGATFAIPAPPSFEAMEEDLPGSTSILLQDNREEQGKTLRENEMLRCIQQSRTEQTPLTFKKLAPLETTYREMAIETLEILLGLCQQRKIKLKQEPCDRRPFNDIIIALRVK